MPESPYRLVMMDLDGTLLDTRSTVTPRTRATLERVHAAGLAVAVATGRSYALVRYFCGDLPLSGPQITFNGAIVVDPLTAQPLFLQAMPVVLVPAVLAFLAEQGIFACYYTADEIYVHDHSPLEVALVPPNFRRPVIVPDFTALLHLPCLKLVVVAEPARIAALRPLAEAAFADRLYVTQTSHVLLEFLHPEVSKGAALTRIIESQGLQPEQVIAFGDSHNDMEMLQVAGTSVAMGNASPEVRAIANLVAPPNTEDGVASTLEALLWPSDS